MVRDKRAFHQLTVQMPLQTLSPNFPENWVGEMLCYRKGNFSRIPVPDKFLLLAQLTKLNFVSNLALMFDRNTCYISEKKKGR